MRIALTDQSPQLGELLWQFKSKPNSFTDYADFREQVTSNQIATVRPLTDLRSCNLDFLFAYTIFPANILQAETEWRLMARDMQVGDVIAQQVCVPPMTLSVKCIFAVRILKIIESPTHIGFQYGTIEGHAESGVSEFAFVVREGELYTHIHTFSEPGNRLSQIAAPFFTLPYQQYCTNRAIDQMTDCFIQNNPMYCVG